MYISYQGNNFVPLIVGCYCYRAAIAIGLGMGLLFGLLLRSYWAAARARGPGRLWRHVREAREQGQQRGLSVKIYRPRVLCLCRFQCPWAPGLYSLAHCDNYPTSEGQKGTCMDLAPLPCARLPLPSGPKSRPMPPGYRNI